MSDVIVSDHLYALPGSKIYHKAISLHVDDRPWLACRWIQIHDLMSTRLAEGVPVEPDTFGHRRCRRCFP